jgi:hypothetical protein
MRCVVYGTLESFLCGDMHSQRHLERAKNQKGEGHFIGFQKQYCVDNYHSNSESIGWLGYVLCLIMCSI